MTALRCQHCKVVVRRVLSLYPATFADGAGVTDCPDGGRQHVAEHTTEVTPSPLLRFTDQFGRVFLPFEDAWGAV